MSNTSLQLILATAIIALIAYGGVYLLAVSPYIIRMVALWVG